MMLVGQQDSVEQLSVQAHRIAEKSRSKTEAIIIERVCFWIQKF